MLRSLDAVKLFHVCASDTKNSEAWSEFLRRYSAKIRFFISGTVRQFSGTSFSGAAFAGGDQESDLFQNAIIRLVSNDCAAMKRFTGKDEGELMAYLAVICRTSVLDTLRRSSAAKRGLDRESKEDVENVCPNSTYRFINGDFERKLLFRELMSMSQDTIESDSGPTSHRDKLVFNLHFLEGLSFSQISQCKGINLSKAGVEKVLKRLIARVQTRATEGRSSETVL